MSSGLDKLKRAGSAGLGAIVGGLGSLSSLVGNDPQRDTVPAYTYGKDNKSYAKTYNATSMPGHLIAQAEQAIASRIPFIGQATANPYHLGGRGPAHPVLPGNFQKLMPIGPALTQLGGDEPPVIQGGSPNISDVQGGANMDVQDAQGTPSYLGRNLQPNNSMVSLQPLQGGNIGQVGNITNPAPQIIDTTYLKRTPMLPKLMPVRGKKFAKATKK
jgi:hypothetical protein